MILRFAAGLLVCLTMFGVVACSDDDDGDSSNTGASRANGSSTGAGSPPASLPDYCDELDKVKTDVDELQSSARSLNRDAAQAAVADLKTDAQAFRSALRDGGDNSELSQAAGDLSGAVEGLETTLRQATQGTAGALGVIQELETQLPVIVSSLNEIRQEARCD
jgi:hypothetical protein